MKKWASIGSVTIIAGVIGWLVVVNPPPPVPRSLCFTIFPITSNNVSLLACPVIVSNASDCPLEYTEGFGKLSFNISYRANGVWKISSISTEGSSGTGLMAPHAVRKDSIKIPKNADAIKLGLDVTSLTWRGRFAWYLAGGAYDRPLSRLPGALAGALEALASF